MAFNKAREEYKWKQWKQAEEKKMRELGVDESVITELREYDWKCFNRERSYQERQIPDSETVEATEDIYGAWQIQQPVSVTELINAIDDRKLKKELLKMDSVTLRIILLKTFGYTTEEIAVQLGMKANTIAARMVRLRKKFKKFLF